VKLLKKFENIEFVDDARCRTEHPLRREDTVSNGVMLLAASGR
jgi:hypothetical protein